MKGPENPQAFPLAIPGDCVSQPDYGMTLRDWFAGQALNGFLAILLDGRLPELGDKTPGQVIAGEAYSLADAMLAERSKP